MSSPLPPDKLRRLVLGFLALTVLVGLYVIWRLDSSPRTDDAYADTIEVAPEVSGRIIELAVKDNQAVRKGDLLFRLDPRPFEAALAMTRASLVSLDKEIDLTRRLTEAQLHTAEAAAAEVERAAAAVAQTRTTLARLEPLLKQGYASAEQVDQARTALRLAETQEAAAVYAARSAASAVGDVEAMLAKREALMAEIALAELALEHATVRAPFDGRVLGLTTTVGQFAVMGLPLFVLADTTTWYVVANFRETELGSIGPGAPARVYLLGRENRRFEARVESVGFGVHPDDGGLRLSGLPVVKRSINWVRVAQRFPVKIAVKDPDQELFRIGASAVAIITGPAPRE